MTPQQAILEMKDPQNYKQFSVAYAELFILESKLLCKPLAQFLIDLWLGGNVLYVVLIVRTIFNIEKKINKYTFYMKLHDEVDAIRHNTIDQMLKYLDKGNNRSLYQVH